MERPLYHRQITLSWKDHFIIDRSDQALAAVDSAFPTAEFPGLFCRLTFALGRGLQLGQIQEYLFQSGLVYLVSLNFPLCFEGFEKLVSPRVEKA